MVFFKKIGDIGSEGVAELGIWGVGLVWVWFSLDTIRISFVKKYHSQKYLLRGTEKRGIGCEKRPKTQETKMDTKKTKKDKTGQNGRKWTKKNAGTLDQM